MNRFHLVKFTFLLFILLGCSSDKSYAPKELWYMAYDADPTIELVPITQPEKRILCKNYGPGCVQGSGKRIRVRLVDLIVVQFESESLARKEAIRLDQYYVRNWIFDEVKEEPVLRDFVTKVFDAKNPTKP